MIKSNNLEIKLGRPENVLSEIKNKVALVTGSTRGIGKVITELLCKKGAIVYINSFKSKEEGETNPFK